METSWNCSSRKHDDLTPVLKLAVRRFMLAAFAISDKAARIRRDESEPSRDVFDQPQSKQLENQPLGVMVAELDRGTRVAD